MIALATDPNRHNPDANPMLARWLRYANARRKAQPPAGAHECVSPARRRNPACAPATNPPVASGGNRREPPEKGWWKRWTRNLDALEARLSPGAGKQRKAFRKKQSAKAVLERDARRNTKRGDDGQEGDL